MEARAHIARVGTPERPIAWTRRLLAALCLYEGEYEHSARYLEEYTALIGPQYDATMRSSYSPVLLTAERHVRQGHPEQALAILEPLCATLTLEAQVLLLPLTAWTYLEAGRVNDAETVATRVVTMVTTAKNQAALVDALWVRTMVATRRGAWAAAAQDIQRGVVLAQAMPYPYAEGRLLSVSGEMRAAIGDPERARECLDAALGIFQRLGARADAERTAQMLSRLAHARRPTPWLALTTRAVSDAQWATIKALLPPASGGRGRPRVDDRGVLEAILYKHRSGCAWADLPAEYGDEATAHRRWRQWQAAGLWVRIRDVLDAAADATTGEDV
jgi:transposase